jgi:H+/Cl- antiporter ClcA
MNTFVQLIKLFAILAAAALLGNWFLHELQSARRRGKPWYAVYLTPPGILVVLASLFLPLAAWYFKKP